MGALMPRGRTAVIVLNRNLGAETDRLCEFLITDGGREADIFVVESGSEPEKCSRYATWNADWPDAVANGLRYARGFNFGLGNLFREDRLSHYDFFFLVCNDIAFRGPVIPVLTDIMQRNPRLGILSPCEERWGERRIMGSRELAYVWHVSHIAWMLRRSFVEKLMCTETPHVENFLYDGSNRRGYFCDIELVVKGYANDFATGLTQRVLFRERTELIREKAVVMRTDAYDLNKRSVLEEGYRWLKRKYGFSSRWQMQQYAKLFYDDFFRLNPDLGRHALFASTATVKEDHADPAGPPVAQAERLLAEPC